MTRKITQHLMENNSYLRWSCARLANKFGCSERTMKAVLNKLEPIKNAYEKNLRG